MSTTRRFLQFHSIYPQALQRVYTTMPHLHFASAAEQVTTHILTGFSSGYLFAPYMRSQGYEPLVFISNDPCSQSQWAREHGITLKERPNWIREIAAHQIETYKPDVLFISEPLELDARLLHGLKHRPDVVLGWRAAPIPPGTNWAFFDAILTNLSALREIAPRLGAKASYHFWPGFERRITDAVANVPKGVDLCFCGQWTSHHAARNALISEIAEHLDRQTLGFSCALHLSGETGTLPPHVARHNRCGLFGLEYYAALKSARIALDARGTTLTVIDPSTGIEMDLFGAETGTNRMIEVTGVGTLLMAQHFSNLAQYFEVGSEMLTFENVPDLLNKVREILMDPNRLHQIAARGHARCMREHSMEVRAQQLEAIVQEIRSSRTQKSANQPLLGASDHGSIEPEKALTFAIQKLQAGEIEEALRYLARIPDSLMIRQRYYVKALCLFKLRDIPAAMAAAEEERRLFPSNPDVIQLLEDLRLVRE